MTDKQKILMLLLSPIGFGLFILSVILSIFVSDKYNIADKGIDKLNLLIGLKK